MYVSISKNGKYVNYIRLSINYIPFLLKILLVCGWEIPVYSIITTRFFVVHGKSYDIVSHISVH